jgi:hypothetical protein
MPTQTKPSWLVVLSKPWQGGAAVQAAIRLPLTTHLRGISACSFLISLLFPWYRDRWRYHDCVYQAWQPVTTLSRKKGTIIFILYVLISYINLSKKSWVVVFGVVYPDPEFRTRVQVNSSRPLSKTSQKEDKIADKSIKCSLPFHCKASSCFRQISIQTFKADRKSFWSWPSP